MLLRFLGSVFALILIIGMLDKAGVKITLKNQEQNHASASLNPLSSGAASEEGQNPGIIEVAADEPARGNGEDYHPQPYHEFRQKASSRSAQPSASPAAFVNRFAETATAQALDKGVPAGISLALGVTKLKQGEKIDSWDDFMNKVVMPLARIKENSYRDGLKAYFKYSANSGRWLEGLSRQGDYSYNALRQAIQQFRLDRYDEEVRTALAEGTKVSPEMERRAGYVADEVSSKIVRERVSYEHTASPAASDKDNVEEWKNYYDETVGREVAKEIARRKLKTGKYITEEDMGRLIDEANLETQKVLKQNNLSFLGREINPNHPDAAEMKDITRPENSQARQELYQKKVREPNFAGNQ